MITINKWLVIFWLITLVVSAGVTYVLAKEGEPPHIPEAITMFTSPSSPTPRPSPVPKPEDFLDDSYKAVKATFFWVGEAADASNDFISNAKSAWDADWQTNFGGLDDPDTRCGFHPCGFTPQENPFYFALPYNDLNAAGKRKASATNIPWFEDRKQFKSVLKNTWIEVKYFDQVCYAQWEDTGPNQYDDFSYVFGDAKPINTFGVRAGIDLSPAVRDCLEMTTNDTVGWKFVDEAEVPEGPWKEIVTTTDVTW